MSRTVFSFLKTLWTSNNPLLRILRVGAAIATVVVLLIVTFEDKLIYFPQRYPEGFWKEAETSGRNPAGVVDGATVPRIDDCRFKTADGLQLHGWYCEPVRKREDGFEPVPTEIVLLWFHGNAGNLSHRYDMIRRLIAMPVSIFIVDYRGYGRSEGKPNESGLYLDGRAAWDYLTAERSVAPERIIVFGKSLGGAVAIDLTASLEGDGVKPAGLIVQSSFTSAADMAATILPLFPRVLLQTKMDSVSKIANISCPKLFIHSAADDVVPYKLGLKLYDAAPAPKEFYEVKNSDHNSTYIVGGQAYLDAIRRFVKSCAP
jgi:fermentation-respiration switch protein FrsA (DUF1100 family)